MNSKTIYAINAVLIIISLFLTYKIYRVIMEPIEFERIKFERLCAITERLEQVREAELAYKSEYGYFAGDFNTLAAFVDTGRVTIFERKDSSYMKMSKIYGKEVNKDTVITRILGYQKVSEKFPMGFEGSMLRQVPMTNGAEFELGAGKIERNGVVVPVFEVSVADVVIFEDVKKRYNQLISKDHVLKIGSLTEATISGNYENTKCKNRDN